MPTTLALFCKVIDNYGDIGICWRLAKQLTAEHGVAVTLWVDDLASFRRICPPVDVTAARQTVDGVAVRHWQAQDQQADFEVADVAEIVIEFFGVDLPPGYIDAMARCAPRPVWLNLEGLTAEEWVEGCHTLPSSHPRLPLTKHFYFPGYTAKTGGLLRETGLARERHAFQHDAPARQAFLDGLGVTPQEQRALLVSLFCYPYGPVSAVLDAWRQGGQPVTCLVPEGVALDAVQAFFGHAPRAGQAATHGALTMRVLPFIPQPDYDRLLWACDLNFVRGEDSWVRAQWAGKPFVWHIYAQDENLHHKKLRAFLQRYAEDQMGALSDFSLCWNGAHDADALGGWPVLWQALHAAVPALTARAAEWEQQMLAHGDLASKLLGFARALR